MKVTIQYINNELKGFYPISEISGLKRIILEWVCGWNYSEQLLNADRVISKADFEKIQQIVDRLKKFEPIQYIFGETEFYGLKIKVNEQVLIPRQETEELVDWMLKSNLPEKSKILDIGTGSGCIALALKKELKNARVFAMDISEDALRVAKTNANLNGLVIDFVQGDILNPEKLNPEFFDVVVSNPPYVRDLEKAEMKNNVLKYEPGLALFVSDENPLIFYRAIAKFAKISLKKNGKLFFEINEYLGAEMTRLLKEFGFADIEIRKDINGKNRMLRCRKDK